MWTVRRDIAASAESVWQVLVDLDAWPRWGPSVSAARSTNRRPLGAGVAGTLRTSVGVSVPFEVTEFVDGRRWAWKVAGVDATSHEVTSRGDGCVLTFGVPWWAPGYLVVCAVALARIDRMVTA